MHFIFITIAALFLLPVSSCQSSLPKKAGHKLLLNETCTFDKQWFEQRFQVKNIYRIDKEYDGTLFIVMFKTPHANDAERLMAALEDLTKDVHMTTTATYYQIYLSKKTAEEICKKN